MKTVIGQRNDSMTARSILRYLPADELMVSDVSVEGEVYVSEAYIDYHSREDSYRPYLRLMGHVNAIQGDMGDVQKVVFNDDPNLPNPRLAPQVSFEYEFSNDELADLSEKGLFDKGFEVPEIFHGNILQLPMECTLSVVNPLNQEDSPIMFVGVKEPYNISTSALASGYASEEEYRKGRVIGLSAYFEKPVSYEQEDTIEDEDYLDYADDMDNAITAPEEKTSAEKIQQVDDVELTDEDKQLLAMYEDISAKANQRVADMESEKKRREAEAEAERENEAAAEDTQEESPVFEDEVSDEDDDFITAEDESDDKSDFVTAEEEEKPVTPAARQVPDNLDAITADSNEDTDEYDV